MGEKPNQKAEIKAKMKNIDKSDGISKAEAIVIAQNYLIDEDYSDKDVIIYKATVTDSQLVTNCWRVIFNATRKTILENGLKWFAIDVDKNTGEIKSQGWGPS